MIRPSRFLHRLRRDERGATVVEFAIVAPVMGLVLLGAFDVSHTLYMRGVLQGIVQKTARDSTLEDSADTTVQNTLDTRVKSQVMALANNATVKITRRYYRTFSQASAARAETFTDSASGIYKNGTCDGGEPYEDANRNGVWDKDGGNDGQGGAKDAVLYTVEVSYPRFFPIYKMIGGSSTTKISSSTVLKNQPYGDQAAYGAMQVRNCT
ncbi:MAG: pilus assembly protein [Sphingomonadales bacterium]|nr:MAG: pilus assembly protein [Sphingomonadales bacterium]